MSTSNGADGKTGRGTIDPPTRADRLAIFYAPEAYSASMPRLMGRNVAGDAFLGGVLRHGGLTEIAAVVDRRDHAEHFSQRVSASDWSGRTEIIEPRTMERLAHYGTLFHPGPDLESHARRRNLHGASAWSICGVTHTTASEHVMNAVAGLVSGSTQPWDAIVCTSAAVHANVTRVLGDEIDRLSQRIGLKHPVLPRLPIIPLGVAVDDFSSDGSAAPGARATLGLADDDVAVLFTGRLSFHAKANPVAMYIALERAARAVGCDVVLIEAGWFANDAIRRAFEAASAQLCPSVRVVRVDGRDAEMRRLAWAAADIFCSFSDNIQETFGLTPIEAMAAGLPVVVSDWDGYRDTVRDGVDGFRVRTLAPVGGAGADIAHRYAAGLDDYDRYCANTSALTAVDIEAATVAFERLFASRDLRRRMGAAGRERVECNYDWSRVLQLYNELWADLAAHRRAAAPAPDAPAALRDPFRLFAAHPTDLLGSKSIVCSTDRGGEQAGSAIDRLRSLTILRHADRVVVNREALVRLLELLDEAGPLDLETLLDRCGAARSAVMLRSVSWLAKVGLVRWTSVKSG